MSGRTTKSRFVGMLRANLDLGRGGALWRLLHLLAEARRGLCRAWHGALQLQRLVQVLERLLQPRVHPRRVALQEEEEEWDVA